MQRLFGVKRQGRPFGATASFVGPRGGRPAAGGSCRRVPQRPGCDAHCSVAAGGLGRGRSRLKCFPFQVSTAAAPPQKQTSRWGLHASATSAHHPQRQQASADATAANAGVYSVGVPPAPPTPLLCWRRRRRYPAVADDGDRAPLLLYTFAWPRPTDAQWERRRRRVLC